MIFASMVSFILFVFAPVCRLHCFMFVLSILALIVRLHEHKKTTQKVFIRFILTVHAKIIDFSTLMDLTLLEYPIIGSESIDSADSITLLLL